MRSAALSWNFTVDASGAEMPSGFRNGETFDSAGEASLALRMRLTEYATSAEVSFLPLWKVTPSRSLKVHVLASGVALHAVASAGRQIEVQIGTHQRVVEVRRHVERERGHGQRGVWRVGGGTTGNREPQRPAALPAASGSGPG